MQVAAAALQQLLDAAEETAGFVVRFTSSCAWAQMYCTSTYQVLHFIGCTLRPSVGEKPMPWCMQQITSMPSGAG